MSDKLMNCRFSRPDATCTLFCFPWAGGGSNFYAAWGENISDNLEVVGITLPGREYRFKDPCDYSARSLADEISQTIHENYNDKPYAFWGHSMGALLSFETAVMMKNKYNSGPVHMYVSGVSAPQSPLRKENNTNVAKMNKTEFIQFLRKLGGTPPEILEDPKMMDIFLPVLRADYSLMDQFDYTLPEGDPPFSCPISFFDGQDDCEHDIRSWKKLTTGPFSVNKFAGDHFYLKEKINLQKLQEIISRDFSGLHEIV